MSFPEESLDDLVDHFSQISGLNSWISLRAAATREANLAHVKSARIVDGLPELLEAFVEAVAELQDKKLLKNMMAEISAESDSFTTGLKANYDFRPVSWGAQLLLAEKEMTGTVQPWPGLRNAVHTAFHLGNFIRALEGYMFIKEVESDPAHSSNVGLYAKSTTKEVVLADERLSKSMEALRENDIAIPHFQVVKHVLVSNFPERPPHAYEAIETLLTGGTTVQDALRSAAKAPPKPPSGTGGPTG